MILVRYVLKELIGPFLASLFGITFLFVVDFLVKILDNVLSKGLPASTVLEIFALNLAWMLSLSIPMAVLVASLMTFGRMSGDQEITAVKAAGISPLSLMRPVLLVALLLSVLMVVFNNWVLPEANHRSVELMNAVSRKKPHVFIDAGRLITQFPGVQLWVNRIDPVSGTLYGIQIFEMEKKGAPRIVYADSATMDYVDNGATLMLRLRSGETHLVDPDDVDNYFRIRFFSQDLAMQNVDDRLERRSRSYRSDREMPVEMMWEVVTDARNNYDTAAVQAKTRRLPTLLRIRDLSMAIAFSRQMPREFRWAIHCSLRRACVKCVSRKQPHFVRRNALGAAWKVNSSVLPSTWLKSIRSSAPHLHALYSC